MRNHNFNLQKFFYFYYNILKLKKKKYKFIQAAHRDTVYSELPSENLLAEAASREQIISVTKLLHV